MINLQITKKIMSKATKRKYVTKEAQEDLTVPSEMQSIVRLVDSRGNNLHEVVESSGEQYLVSMPVKFRRNIWVKRGDYVLVEPIAEGDKVKAEIVKILRRDHIKFYKSQGCWPEKFDEKVSVQSKLEESSDDDSDELFVNTNRQNGCSKTFDESEREAMGRLKLEDSSDDESSCEESSEDDRDELFINTNKQNCCPKKFDEREEKAAL